MKQESTAVKGTSQTTFYAEKKMKRMGVKRRKFEK